MMRGSIAFSAVALLFCILTAGSRPATAQIEEPVYGRQLMTQQEMRQYREKMRAATSDEARQQIRAEHHAEMQERARSKGILLPDQAPVRGIGRGMGPGPGADPGQGNAPGAGR